MSKSLSQDSLQQAEIQPYVLITFQGMGLFHPFITEEAGGA